MKKYTWLILLSGLFILTACNEAKSDTATSSSASEEQILKTQIFEVPLTDGTKQKQTVIYKTNKLVKLVLKNNLTMTDEIKQSISEVGVAETKKLVLESMAQDELYTSLDKIKGLTYQVDLTESQEFYITFTLDVPNLDTAALSKSSFFEGSEMDDVTILSAKEYIERLKTYGATEVKQD